MYSIRVIILSFFTIIFLDSCKVDNTSKTFDDITVSNENHSLIFLFADQANFISRTTEDSIFQKALKGTYFNVNPNKVHGFTLFPTNSDNISYNTAQKFLDIYAGGGVSNPVTYPNIVEGLTNHQTNYTAWKNAINTTANATSICSIGYKTQKIDNNLNFFVKTQFESTVNNLCTAALYVISKETLSPQDTSIDKTMLLYPHKNILKGVVSHNVYGDTLANHNQNGINKNTFSYTFLSETDKSNLYFLLVIYEMEAGLPKSVLNCRVLNF